MQSACCQVDQENPWTTLEVRAPALVGDPPLQACTALAAKIRQGAKWCSRVRREWSHRVMNVREHGGQGGTHLKRHCGHHQVPYPHQRSRLRQGAARPTLPNAAVFRHSNDAPCRCRSSRPPITLWAALLRRTVALAYSIATESAQRPTCRPRPRRATTQPGSAEAAVGAQLAAPSSACRTRTTLRSQHWLRPIGCAQAAALLAVDHGHAASGPPLELAAWGVRPTAYGRPGRTLINMAVARCATMAGGTGWRARRAPCPRRHERRERAAGHH